MRRSGCHFFGQKFRNYRVSLRHLFVGCGERIRGVIDIFAHPQLIWTEGQLVRLKKFIHQHARVNEIAEMRKIPLFQFFFKALLLIGKKSSTFMAKILQFIFVNSQQKWLFDQNNFFLSIFLYNHVLMTVRSQSLER